ncbi:MAG: glycosyltransferase family A protein [Cyanobacteria bacterium J06581_3]
MPRVTVVIPVYNSLDYLPDAVESALEQTFGDIEVIIVNDGSSDNTEQWVLSQSDPRIILISQENLGKSAARNRGIAASKGEYIAFLDADDLWETTKLEKQVRCLESAPDVGLVYTWTALADESGQPTGRILASPAEGNVWKPLMLKNILACGSTPMVRRQCFEVAGLFSSDLPLAQDWDMWIRIAARYEFALIKQPLVRYRKHTGNTSAKWELMQQCSCLVLDRAFESAPGDFSDLALSNIHDEAYTSLYLYLGWLAIQKNAPTQALYFWQKSQETVTNKLFKEALRLRINIFIVRWLGEQNYHRFRSIGYTGRRLLLAIVTWTFESTKSNSTKSNQRIQ